MFNRRRFLQTTFATVMIPPGVGISADEVLGGAVSARIFVTGGCADAARFMAAAGETAMYRKADAGDLISDLRAAGDEATVLFGLTRDSDYVPLRQIALEKGYRDIYLGRHRYRGDGVHHTVSAGRAVADDVVRALAAADASWAGALARATAVVTSSPGLTAERTAVAAVDQPADSLGSKVSWAMRKGS